MIESIINCTLMDTLGNLLKLIDTLFSGNNHNCMAILLTCRFSVTDVHPDHHPDGVHEPERHCVPGHALHPQGVRHYLPSGAERPEEKAQLQSCGAGCHCVHAPVPEVQRQTERRVQDRAGQITVK